VKFKKKKEIFSWARGLGGSARKRRVKRALPGPKRCASVARSALRSALPGQRFLKSRKRLKNSEARFRILGSALPGALPGRFRTERASGFGSGGGGLPATLVSSI